MWVTFKHCDLIVTGWKDNVPISTKNHEAASVQAENPAQSEGFKQR
jgi:hypothetical protein